MVCTGCHDPHGGSNKLFVKDVSHEPFARKKCSICHGSEEGVTSAKCLSCHTDTQRSFWKLNSHLFGKNSCIDCHNPHVGDDKNLLIDTMPRTCERCHVEIYKRKKNSLYTHPNWSRCLDCHAAHGSDYVGMLVDGDVCVKCHKTQGRFTHPVGEKVLDPRNGQPITCITCHDPMGTNFKYNLRLSGEATLCLECHKNY